MAAISITAANVRFVSGDRGSVQAGAALTAGLPIYIKESDGKAYKTDSDTAAEAVFAGICLGDCAADQYVNYAKPGSVVNMGATLAVGGLYIVGPTAGEIVPFADHASGDYLSIVGWAQTAANMYISGGVSGVAKA